MNPTTRAEAEAYRYGRWAGNPKGTAFDPRYCAQPIIGQGRAGLPQQCGRRAGRGPEALWCPAHDPVRVAAKRLADGEAQRAACASDDAIEQEGRRLLTELGVEGGGLYWRSLRPVRAIVIPFDQATVLLERLRGRG